MCEELTPAQLMAIDSRVEKDLARWFRVGKAVLLVFGVANLAVLLVGLFQLFVILPDKAISEGIVRVRESHEAQLQELENRGFELSAALDTTNRGLGEAMARVNVLLRMEEELAALKDRASKLGDAIAGFEQSRVSALLTRLHEVQSFLEDNDETQHFFDVVQGDVSTRLSKFSKRLSKVEARPDRIGIARDGTLTLGARPWGFNIFPNGDIVLLGTDDHNRAVEHWRITVEGTLKLPGR